MHANAHCALSRDARIGLPATMTVTGFVCSSGNCRTAIQLLRSTATGTSSAWLAAVRRHFAARHGAAVDHHFDEALLAQVKRIGLLLFADQDGVADVAPAADGDRAAIGGLERGLGRKGDGGLDESPSRAPRAVACRPNACRRP